MTSVDIQITKAHEFLLKERARYKCVHGGRGKGASWNFARSILTLGLQRPMRVLCCREIQTTIKDSVHQLFKDQIKSLDLGYYYRPLENRIDGIHGTTIGYAGLRHNVDELKSWEGADLAWVTEAKNTTRNSWNILTPTIRKDGSEIWVDYNPELESDETHQRFVVNPPKDSIVRALSWRDNPFFNEVLRKEMEDLKARDYDEYEVVWEGRTRSTIKDAIYADEMRAAEKGGRLCSVPYDPSSLVHTFWDLGFGNHTSIWVAQRVGLEWRFLAFIEDSNKFLAHYVAELDKLAREHRYVWGTDFLPHDARQNHLGGESIEKQLKTSRKSVEVLDQDNVDVGINAARNVFPFCWFDLELCADGIQCLRHYKWKTNSDGIVTSREPLHDEYSDGADAFRTFAMARNRPAKSKAKEERKGRNRIIVPSVGSGGEHAWMG